MLSGCVLTLNSSLVKGNTVPKAGGDGIADPAAAPPREHRSDTGHPCIKRPERPQNVWLPPVDAGFERLAPGGRVEFAPIRTVSRSLLPTAERKRPSLRGEVFP